MCDHVLKKDLEKVMFGHHPKYDDVSRKRRVKDFMFFLTDWSGKKKKYCPSLN